MVLKLFDSMDIFSTYQGYKWYKTFSKGANIPGLLISVSDEDKREYK